MRTEARFPGVADGARHYESFYLKATRPGGGRGIWLRHTVHKRAGERPTASVWLTLFDADADGPRAAKVTVDESALATPEGGYIRVAEALLEPGRALGSIAAGGLEASWELAIEPGPEAFHHLPYPFLYAAPLPRTKFLSPHPAASFTGTLTVDGERLDVDAWPGMVGHNWGAEHAERWVWVQASELRGGEGYFDAALGRIKLGPLTTPWVGNAMLRLDGVEHRLGGFDRIRSTRLDPEPSECEFTLTGKGVRVRGRVSSEPRNFVAWVYADPKGPEHNTLNCSIADLELELELDGAEPRRIESVGAAAYELGTRDTDHGVPVQPYSDG